MKFLSNVFASVLSLILLGCTTDARIDLDAERASLAEAVEAYHASMSALNPQAAASLYMEDVIVIPKGKIPFTGRQAAEDYLTAAAGNPGFQPSFETLVVEVSGHGSSGYSAALVTVKYDGPDGEPIYDVTRDVHFWEKDGEGEWRIALDTWNAAPTEVD